LLVPSGRGAVSLNDRRVIAEINIHPTVFLPYLVRRLEVNSYEAITVSDELDLFGHFLAQDVCFREDEMVRVNSKVALTVTPKSLMIITAPRNRPTHRKASVSVAPLTSRN
jgi:hypothetical protein